MQVPVTPIPGTAIPNPLGNSLGGGIQLDENFDVQGVTMSGGVGTQTSGQATEAGVISVETIFRSLFDAKEQLL